MAYNIVLCTNCTDHSNTRLRVKFLSTLHQSITDKNVSNCIYIIWNWKSNWRCPNPCFEIFLTMNLMTSCCLYKLMLSWWWVEEDNYKWTSENICKNPQLVSFPPAPCCLHHQWISIAKYGRSKNQSSGPISSCSLALPYTRLHFWRGVRKDAMAASARHHQQIHGGI